MIQLTDTLNYDEALTFEEQSEEVRKFMTELTTSSSYVRENDERGLPLLYQYETTNAYVQVNFSYPHQDLPAKREISSYTVISK